MLRALHNVHLLVEWQQLHPQCEAAAYPLSHSNTIGATEGEDKQARKYKYEKTRSLKVLQAGKQTTVPILLQIRLKTLKYLDVSGLWTCQLAFKRICVKSAQMQKQIQIQLLIQIQAHMYPSHYNLPTRPLLPHQHQTIITIITGSNTNTNTNTNTNIFVPVPL